jgi:hypothetical protein
LLRFAAGCGFDVQTTSIAHGITFSSAYTLLSGYMIGEAYGHRAAAE